LSDDRLHSAGVLSAAERAEVCRQGAKAAARGECASVNPFHHRRNAPSSTGEPHIRCTERSRAWRAGHDFERGRGAIRRALRARDSR
jgi:hypothetical protein